MNQIAARAAASRMQGDEGAARYRHHRKLDAPGDAPRRLEAPGREPGPPEEGLRQIEGAAPGKMTRALVSRGSGV